MRRVLLFVVFAIGCGKKAGTDSGPEPGTDPRKGSPNALPGAPLDVPAVDLTRHYQQNPIVADGQFKGKLVRTTLTIHFVSRDGGRAYIGPASALGDAGYVTPHYYFFLADDSQAAGVTPENTYTIEGRCLGWRKDGIDRGGANSDWRVEFDGCRVVRK